MTTSTMGGDGIKCPCCEKELLITFDNTCSDKQLDEIQKSISIAKYAEKKIMKTKFEELWKYIHNNYINSNSKVKIVKEIKKSFENWACEIVDNNQGFVNFLKKVTAIHKPIELDRFEMFRIWLEKEFKGEKQ